MTDEPHFRNHFHDTQISNLIQAHLVQLHTPPPPRPMEIAGPPRHWVDRDDLLAALRRQLAADPAPVAVTGPPGTGKSALAAKLAHQVHQDYPDGQLYIDLDNDDLLTAARAALLRLGIAKDQLADTFGGLLAHFRSATHDKAMLVVVDGAADAAEGLHFALSSPRSRLLVCALEADADPDLRHHRLDDLDRRHAEALLTAMSTGLEPETATGLIHQYGTSPATVRRLAGLIRARHRGGRDDAAGALMDHPPADLLEATYRTLSASAAWLYRLLSVLPGSEFEQSILDVFETPGESGRAAFDELVDAQLITLTRPGWCLIEPAVSRDAAARAETDTLPIELLAAMRTSLRWYVKRAQLADRSIMGERLRRARLTDIDAPGFTTRADALTWLGANHTALQAAVRMAALHGWNDDAWALAEAMWALYNNVPYPEEAERCYQVAVEAATRPTDRARMLLFLGRARLDLGRFDEAETALREARDLAEADDDTELVGSSVELIGRSRHWQHRYREAVEHYRDALARARADGRRRAEGIRLLYLGRAHRDLDEPDTAAEHFDQALAVFTRIGDGRHVLLTETDRLVLAARLGAPDAIAAADRAIAWLREAGLARHEAEAHERLAAALTGHERRRRLEAALEVYERVGSVEARRVRGLLA